MIGRPMLEVTLLTLGSVVGVSLVSLVGVVYFIFDEAAVRKTLLYAVSFSTGALFGDVFIHMLPEMAEEDGFAEKLLVVLAGIVFSFVVEKVINWRHCHAIPGLDDEHDRDHHHHHSHLGAMSIMGDGVHNFIDGVVIASSFLAGIPIGISTTLAVVFHEIPDEVGNFAVLLHSGYGRKKAILFNLLSALAAVAGAVFVLLMSGSIPLTGFFLPFAAGNLLYIAGSDLIPELHKETNWKASLGQLLALICGMAAMYLLLFLA